MSFSHFGELWLAGSHSGGITSGMYLLYTATNWMQAADAGGSCRRVSPEIQNWVPWLGGAVGIGGGGVAESHGGICVLQAC